MPEKERLDRIVQMCFSIEEADAIRYLATRLHLSASVMCKKILLNHLKQPIFEAILDPKHKPIKQVNEKKREAGTILKVKVLE